MRKINNSVFILIVGLLFSGLHSYAQTQPGLYHELIIQVPGIVHERGYPEIKNALDKIDGIKMMALCEKQSLILLKYDQNILKDERMIFSKISELHFKFYVKQEATIARAMSACNKSELPGSDFGINTK